MALNTGINSLNTGAPDIKYTGTEGPQENKKTAALSNYLQYVQAMHALNQDPMPIEIFHSLEGIMSIPEMIDMGSPGKAQGGRIGYDTGGNIRQRPHQSRDLLVSKTASGERPKYQPPSQGGGFANTGGGGGDGGHHRDVPVTQSFPVYQPPTVSTTAAHEDLGAGTTIAELERAIEDAARTDLVSPIGDLIDPYSNVTGIEGPPRIISEPQVLPVDAREAYIADTSKYVDPADIGTDIEGSGLAKDTLANLKYQEGLEDFYDEYQPVTTSGEGINVPGTPIVPLGTPDTGITDTGLTADEAFASQVAEQMAANEAAKAKMPFEHYYVGGDPTAEQVAFMRESGAAPSTVGLEQYAARGGRVPAAFGGVMGQDGRRAYGLGSIFKKAAKAVKSIVKSPIGKIALMAGLGGIPFGATKQSLFQRMGPMLFGKASGVGPGVEQARKVGGILNWIKKNPDKAALYGGTALTLSPFLMGQEEDENLTAENFYRGPHLDLEAHRRRVLAGNLDRAVDPFMPASYYAAQGGRAGYANGEFVSPHTDDDDYVSPREAALAALYNPGTYVQRRRGVMAAAGGRIGYFAGGPLIKKGVSELLKKFKRPIFSFDDEAKMIMDLTKTGKYTEKELMQLDGDQLVEIYVREGFTPPKAIPNVEETINLKNITPKIKKASGGRIGYDAGGQTGLPPITMGQVPQVPPQMPAPQVPHSPMPAPQPNRMAIMNRPMMNPMMNRGMPRRMAQEGGLMDLGGMEKDYRNEGGFVALGGEEKADDVPARLSKNEFVFTADAVRGAGDGDIDKGAEIMENVMKNLEQGGKISDKTQGLAGAQEMFGVSERLSEVV